MKSYLQLDCQCDPFWKGIGQQKFQNRHQRRGWPWNHQYQKCQRFQGECMHWAKNSLVPRPEISNKSYIVRRFIVDYVRMLEWFHGRLIKLIMIYDTIITPEITRLFQNQLKWGFFLIKNIWSLGKIVKMSKLYFELIEYLTRLFLFILLLVIIIN